MREAEIEKLLSVCVEAAGGKTYKWISPGCTGVPDRIVLLPRGQIEMIELKKPGAKPDPRQEIVHATLRELGAKVWVISTLDELSQFFQDIGQEEISKELDCRYDL